MKNKHENAIRILDSLECGGAYTLNIEEEYDIIKYVHEYGEHIGAGSSRAVFGLDRYPEFVVKIAIDKGGRQQNDTELRTFFNTNYGLANIYATGFSILIMERVEVINIDWNLEDLISALHDDALDLEVQQYWDKYREYDEEDAKISVFEYLSRDLDVKLTREQLKEFVEVIEHLSNFLGDTPDNYQLGINQWGQVVAYDYGFDTEIRDRSVSDNLSEIVFGLDNPNDIIYEIV